MYIYGMHSNTQVKLTVPILSGWWMFPDQRLGWEALLQSLGHPVVGKYHTLCNHLMHLQRLHVTCMWQDKSTYSMLTGEDLYKMYKGWTALHLCLCLCACMYLLRNQLFHCGSRLIANLNSDLHALQLQPTCEAQRRQPMNDDIIIIMLLTSPFFQDTCDVHNRLDSST